MITSGGNSLDTRRSHTIRVGIPEPSTYYRRLLPLYQGRSIVSDTAPFTIYRKNTPIIKVSKDSKTIEVTLTDNARADLENQVMGIRAWLDRTKSWD